MNVKDIYLSVRPVLSCVDAPVIRNCSLFNSGRRVKHCRVSGLLMQRIEGCRWPEWRFSDRIHIGRSRSKVPRNCIGFPNPVSMPVCPCTVLGFPRVSGVAHLRSRFQSGHRTLIGAAPSLPKVSTDSCAYSVRPVKSRSRGRVRDPVHFFGAYILNYTTNKKILPSSEDSQAKTRTEFLKQGHSEISFLLQQRIALVSA